MAIDDSRKAIITLGADPSAMDPGLDAARKKLKAFESAIRKSERKGRSKGAGAAMAGFVGGLTSSLTGAAMSYVKDAAVDVMDVEKAITRLQIAGDRTPGQMEGFRRKLGEISKASGVARGELVAGTSAYVALTGDIVGAETAMGMFAKVANASGASMSDIATTAASMRDNLKMRPEDFQSGFDILITQGKAGAIELKELASLLSGLAPSFSQFKGGTGAKGLADLGAAFQVARKGFGSAEEASTGIRSLMVAISRNAKRFQDAGVKIFQKNPKTGRKELRGFYEILDSISKKKFDSTQLIQMFGRDEAKRAYDQLIDNRDLARSLAAESAGSNAVEKDNAKWLESTAGRMQLAMNSLKEAVANALTPERIEAFAKVMERVVGLVGEAAKIFEGWMTGNSPLQRRLRKELGYETEDDKVTRGLEQTMKERHAEMSRWMPSGAVQPHLENEDTLMRQLNTGRKSTGEAYTPEEILAFRDMMKLGTMSGPTRGLFDQQFAHYLATATARQQANIQYRLQVIIGSETVKTTNKDAKSNRSTPGGTR